MLRKNRTIDWQKKETARATMRKMVKRLLKKYKYPPEDYEEAISTVISQCEMWTDNMDAAPAPVVYSFEKPELQMVAESAAHYGEYTLDEAWKIAKKVDPQVDKVIEFSNGWHFMRKSDEFSMNDAGFAVAKADGRVYHGIAAHEYLK